MTVLMLSSQSKCNYVSASASVSRDSKLDLLCVRRTATLYSADSQAVGSLEKYYLVNLSTSVPQRSRRYMCSIDYIFLLHNNTDVITSQLLCFSLFSVCVHLSVSLSVCVCVCVCVLSILFAEIDIRSVFILLSKCAMVAWDDGNTKTHSPKTKANTRRHFKMATHCAKELLSNLFLFFPAKVLGKEHPTEKERRGEERKGE